MIDINLNLPIDTTPTDGSTNLIDSNAVFDALELSKLHDVNTTGAVTGNVLALDGDVWKPTTISSGLTIGTTPITSGVDTRLLLQIGGVVSQSAMLTLNDTGVAGSTTANFANTFKRVGNNFEIYGANGVTNMISSEGGGTALNFTSTFQNVHTAGNNHNFRIGTGAPVSAMYINSSRNVGIGTTSPAAKLDIRAQGALSTDIAFRVRNSADSANLLALNGLGNLFLSPPTLYGETAIYGDATDPILRYTHSAFGSVALGHGAKVATAFPNYTDAYNIAIGLNASTAGTSGAIAMGFTARCIGTYGIKIGHHQGVSSFGGTNSIHLGRTTSGNDILADNVFMTYFNSQSSSTLTRSNGSFGLLGQQAYIIANGTGTYGLDKFMGDGGNTFVVRNHTSIPSLNIIDSFQQYSADITAGNAAPHFRTENGSVVKLYKQDLPTSPTNAELATFLSNLGLANLI